MGLWKMMQMKKDVIINLKKNKIHKKKEGTLSGSIVNNVQIDLMIETLTTNETKNCDITIWERPVIIRAPKSSIFISKSLKEINHELEIQAYYFRIYRYIPEEI